MFSLLRLSCATRIWTLIGIFVVVAVITMIFYRKKVQNYQNISEKLIESNDRERQKRNVVKENTLHLDAVHDREFVQKRKKKRLEIDESGNTLLGKEKNIEISSDPNEQLSDALFRRNTDMQERQMNNEEPTDAESETALESDDDLYSLLPEEEKPDITILSLLDKEKVDEGPESLRKPDSGQINNEENQRVTLNPENTIADVDSEEKMGNEMSNDYKGTNSDFLTSLSVSVNKDDTSKQEDRAFEADVEIDYKNEGEEKNERNNQPKIINFSPQDSVVSEVGATTEKEDIAQMVQDEKKEQNKEKTDAENKVDDDKESDATPTKASAAIKTAPLFGAIDKALHAYPVFPAAAKKITDEMMPSSIVTENVPSAEQAADAEEDKLPNVLTLPSIVTENAPLTEPVASIEQDKVADELMPPSVMTENVQPAETGITDSEDKLADALTSSIVSDNAPTAEVAVGAQTDKLTDELMPTATIIQPAPPAVPAASQLTDEAAPSLITANETVDMKLARDSPGVIVKIVKDRGDATPLLGVDNQPETPAVDQLANQVKDSALSDVKLKALETLSDAKTTDAPTLESDISDQETKKVSKRHMPVGLINAESSREQKLAKKNKSLKVDTKRR